MYTLIIEDRHGKSKAEISFDQGSYTIGRVDGNDVVLPSNSVSRTHARIFVSNNKCYIDDLGSANGVHVDGAQIKERTEIRNGAKIRIGEYTLYLEYKDQNEMNAGQDVLKTQIVSNGQSGYKIVRICDKFAGEEFMLSEATNSIGRTEDNYILLSDQSISRNHAKISNRGMTFFVTDLASSNGTFVNNKRINIETPLQPGDQVKFGNVSFVFVPASQKVDIHQYKSKKNDDNKKILAIVGVMALLVVVVLVFGLYYTVSRNSGDGDNSVAQEELQKASEAKFETQIEKVKTLYKDKHFSSAKEVLAPLLNERSDDKELTELKDKIDFEIKNETFIKDGQSFLENKKFVNAIELFKKVDVDSANFELANDLIKETERKIRLTNFNEARSHCDDGVSEESLRALCNAAMELGDTEVERTRLEETKHFMEGIAKNKKNKFFAAAKNCLNSLNE